MALGVYFYYCEKCGPSDLLLHSLLDPAIKLIKMFSLQMLCSARTNSLDISIYPQLAKPMLIFPMVYLSVGTVTAFEGVGEMRKLNRLI